MDEFIYELEHVALADLSPPLGYPGGPCHVVERIVDKVPSPKARDDLEDDIMRNQKLSNKEAHRIYRPSKEPGTGRFKRIEITPHAQYRMDLRGITVTEVRLGLSVFQKELNDWKSRGDGRYVVIERSVRAGEPVEYFFKKLGLFMVFVIYGSDVKLVTVYWKNQQDPRAPNSCDLPMTKSRASHLADKAIAYAGRWG